MLSEISARQTLRGVRRIAPHRRSRLPPTPEVLPPPACMRLVLRAAGAALRPPALAPPPRPLEKAPGWLRQRKLPAPMVDLERERPRLRSPVQTERGRPRPRNRISAPADRPESLRRRGHAPGSA